MRKFNLEESIKILDNTPDILYALLRNLTDNWVYSNEGEATWSPFHVVGHLIHGEKTDWIPRLKIILFEENKDFLPFDRFAQFENSKGKTLSQLLNEFQTIRKENLDYLTSLNLSASDWNKEGIHPEFGPVTAQQLIATWVTHDLGHIAQISRVMAKQYKQEVGPWIKYITVLRR